MRKFYTLLSREVRGYFHSPIAYIVLIFFLIVSGIDFYFQVSFMNQRHVQYTVQDSSSSIRSSSGFAFVLIFPLITMRLFAEEFKLGTIEPLTTAPVRDWQVVLSKYFRRAGLLPDPLDPDAALLLDFSKSNKPACRAFRRRILGLVSDTFVAGNVLSFDWLFHFCSNPEPDHRGHHFFLRNYSAIFSRPSSVHPSGCYLSHARFAGLLLRDRTHGDLLAGCDRYAADRALCEHDHCDADAHLSGIPIP